MAINKNNMRDFGNGAIRDTSNGKYDYFGFRHPLCEHSFAGYMYEHRKMSDGTLREPDNWWAGWDKKISLQSMVRHLEDLQAIKAGLIVFEIKENGETIKILLKNIDEANEKVKEWKKLKIDFKWITEEDCCNAIRFNADAYKLQILK